MKEQPKKGGKLSQAQRTQNQIAYLETRKIILEAKIATLQQGLATTTEELVRLKNL